MEKPRFRVKADKHGWFFYDTDNSFLGLISYTGFKGLKCKLYLKLNKHLK